MNAFTFPQWASNSPALAPQQQLNTSDAETERIAANKLAYAAAQQKVAEQFAAKPEQQPPEQPAVRRKGWPKGKPRK